MTQDQIFWLVVKEIIIPAFAWVIVIYLLLVAVVYDIVTWLSRRKTRPLVAHETRNRFQTLLRSYPPQTRQTNPQKVIYPQR